MICPRTEFEKTFRAPFPDLDVIPKKRTLQRFMERPNAQPRGLPSRRSNCQIAVTYDPQNGSRIHQMHRKRKDFEDIRRRPPYARKVPPANFSSYYPVTIEPCLRLPNVIARTNPRNPRSVYRGTPGLGIRESSRKRRRCTSPRPNQFRNAQVLTRTKEHRS